MGLGFFPPPQECTMPIVDKLKEALKPGRKDSAEDGDLGKLLAASAKKVLLQRIEFEPASKSFSYQLESLKSKYVLLNSRAEGASRHKSGDELQARKPGTGGCVLTQVSSPELAAGVVLGFQESVVCRNSCHDTG